MPIKHAIWTVGGKPAPLALGRLASEQPLVEMIAADPRILSARRRCRQARCRLDA